MAKKEYRHFGKNSTRYDAGDIVTGKSVFVDDVKLRGLLHGKALRSPYPSAKVKHIDISKAEAVPGVHAVLYYGNMPAMCDGWGINTPPICPILRNTVSFVGDPVALVAADTVEIAEKARDLIEVEYEVLPAVLSSREAAQPDAPLVHPEEFPSNVLPNVPFIGELFMDNLKRGDVDKAFEECDFVDESDGDYHALGCPMAMEPPSIIMSYNDATKRMKTWATSQIAAMYGMVMSGRMKGLPVDNNSVNVGGGFGNKAELPLTSMETAILSCATHHPVKMTLTKTEQLTCHEQRIGMYVKAKIGIKDGYVHAVRAHLYLDVGAYNMCAQWQMGVGLGECQLAFGKCRNWDFTGDLVMTNHVSCGSVRGFGGQEIKCTLMPIAARLCAKAGMDPLEFMKKNFAQTGDGWYWRDRKWYDCKEQDFVPAMIAAGEKFGWKDKFKGWYKPTWTDGHKAIGVGVSTHGNADVGEDNSTAYCRIAATGEIFLNAGITETGAGQRSNIRKYAAEVLDCPIESVILATCNSDCNPYDAGPCGSRCTHTLGTAVTKAAEDALRKLLDKAAEHFQVSPADLCFHDNMIYIRSRMDQPHAVPEIFGPGGFGRDIIGVGHYEANYQTSNFNIYFSEVEVDLDTGATELKRVVIGTDVGQIVDPATLEMQVHGSFAAACADAGLMDENVLDRSTGRLLTANMIDYKWRPFNEFPPIDGVILESQPEISRFKCIGFGEIAGAPGPASMMMAISNAIGKDYCEYPASREGILRTLGKL